MNAARQAGARRGVGEQAERGVVVVERGRPVAASPRALNWAADARACSMSARQASRNACGVTVSSFEAPTCAVWASASDGSDGDRDAGKRESA